VTLQIYESRRGAGSYGEWVLQVIECICNEEQINAAAKIEEIKCSLRKDGHYPESYAAGEMPEEAWHNELGAIKDSR